MRKLPVSHAAIGRLIIGLTLVAIAVYVNWSRLPSIQAQDDNRAGLVIQHGDGETTAYCVDLPNETNYGYDLFVASDLDLKAEINGTSDIAICRIDNEGCAFSQEQCFCQCTGNPEDRCIYWNYWKLDTNNEWVHSGLGAASSEVRGGDVDAWSWSEVDSFDQENEPEEKPPVMTFLEICEPELAAQTAVATAQTATAVAEILTAEAPTQTHTPTPTHTPTQTPTPTETSVPKPVILTFDFEPQEIIAGESVVLTWETEGADNVLLRKPDDSEQGVGKSSSMTIKPSATSTYVLIARNSGGEDSIRFTITVLPAPEQSPTPTSVEPTATPADGDSPVVTPVAADQQATPAVQEAAPTAIVISAPPSTPTPEQQPADSVIVISAPPNTPTPTETATAPPAVDTPTQAPTPTPISATPTPTNTVVVEAIPDSSAPSSTGSNEVVVVGDEDAAENASVSDGPQLVNIFMGMIFIMAVPLILGLAWMGLRAMRGSRR